MERRGILRLVSSAALAAFSLPRVSRGERLEPRIEPEPDDVEPATADLAAPIDVDEQPPVIREMPVALDPVEEKTIPTFSRLRSQRLVLPDPEWFDRGPLI